MKNIDVLQVVIPLIQNYMFDVYAVETTDTDVIIKIDVVNVTEAPRFDIVIDKNYVSEKMILNQLHVVESLI